MVFIESRIFTRRLEDLAGSASVAVLAQIQRDLLKHPERGDLVQGLGGIRKARTGNPSRLKGKRGGFRYLFLYLQHRQHIHLLLLLDKGEQDDLTNDERKVLRKLVEQIRQESRGKL